MPVKDLSAKSKNKQAKRASFHLPCLLSRLPAEGVGQITGGSSHLKRYRLKIGPSTSNDLIKKKKISPSVHSHLHFS